MEKSQNLLAHYDALKIYEGKGYVFKRCLNNNIDDGTYDCLIILQKPIEHFKCNESRKSVQNKDFAKFRCNGLLTIAIYDLRHKVFIYSLNHVAYYSCQLYKITYKVNTVTLPHDYDEDVEVICAPGIHYLLTLEAAINYKNGEVSQTFERLCKNYGENGQIIYEVVNV